MYFCDLVIEFHNLGNVLCDFCVIEVRCLFYKALYFVGWFWKRLKIFIVYIYMTTGNMLQIFLSTVNEIALNSV